MFKIVFMYYPSSLLHNSNTNTNISTCLCFKYRPNSFKRFHFGSQTQTFFNLCMFLYRHKLELANDLPH